MNEVPIQTSFAIQIKGLTDAITGDRVEGANITLKILLRDEVLYQTTFINQGQGDYLAMVEPINAPNGAKGFLHIEATKTVGGNEFRLTIKRPITFRFLE